MGCPRLLALLLACAVAPAAAAAPPGLTILTPKKGGSTQLVTLRGEVRLKRYPQDTFEPITAPVTLARRDEIETRAGTAEIEVENGMVVELGEGTIIAVIGRDSGTDLFFLKGTLRARAGKGGEVHSVQVISPAGRMTLRGRDVRLRGEGTSTTVQVYEGLANVWGRGGVVVRTGQMTQVDKGQPPAPPRSLQAAASPTWVGEAGLHLGGDAPPVVVLRWQAAQPGAGRYRLELVRTDEPGHAPLVVETEATRAELRDLRVGAYQARVSALDEKGGRGEPSEARRLVVAGLAGLSGGAVTLAAGALPRIFTPTGLAATVAVDGAPLGVRGLPAGDHRLQIALGGLSIEVPAHVTGGAVAVAPAPARPAPAVEAPAITPPARRPAAQAQGTPPAPPAEEPTDERPDTSRPPLLGRAAPAALAEPAAEIAMGPEYSTAAPDAAPDAPPPEDALLLGPSEVPGGGLRSPWAGRIAQVRFESTAAGAARLVVHGRVTLRNGFGGEIGFSVLRAQLGAPLSGDATAATSYGDLTASLRTPALRRPRFALQGIVSAVVPIGGGALDRGLYEVPAGAAPVSLQPGGGWRVEAAALFGLRLGRVAIMTQQGVSLRLTAGLLPAYEGGVMLQADALQRLRLLAFCQWNANYLGVPVEAGDGATDSGAAVGGGVEVFLPGPFGGARLAALGRAGIGTAGAAVYGRGTVGLQVGYRFR